MIRDYPELISEVSRRSGVTDVANHAAMYVGMAETALSKMLRVGEMETAAEVTTDANGDATLPTDYAEMRSILIGTREVERKSLPLVLAGSVCGYAVQGKTLKSTFKSTTHSCVYYAAIPSLDTANTNWLLESEPEIYLQAVLKQIYIAKTDVERASATATYLAGLIEDANTAARTARLTGTRISLGNIVP